MILPDRLRLPFDFDPGLLLRDLETVASAGWTQHYIKSHYHGDWGAIPLRATAGATHPIQMIFPDPTAKVFEDTPLLGACPYFGAVLKTFRCSIRAVRLMNLTPGSRLVEHTDPDLGYADGSVRIHVPIRTNPNVVFEVNRRRVVMEAGTSWYIRLSDPHSVANNGASDRVHMLIDALFNGWLVARFEAAMASARHEAAAS